MKESTVCLIFSLLCLFGVLFSQDDIQQNGYRISFWVLVAAGQICHAIEKKGV